MHTTLAFVAVVAAAATAVPYYGPLPGVYCGTANGGAGNATNNPALFLTVWETGFWEVADFRQRCNMVGNVLVADATPAEANITFMPTFTNCPQGPLPPMGLLQRPTGRLSLQLGTGLPSYNLVGGANGPLGECARGVLPTGDFCAAKLPTGDAAVFSVDQNFGYTLNILPAAGGPGCRMSGSVWNYGATGGGLVLTVDTSCPAFTIPAGEYTFDPNRGEDSPVVRLTFAFASPSVGTHHVTFSAEACRRPHVPSGQRWCGETGDIPAVSPTPTQVLNAGIVLQVGQLAHLGSADASYQLSIFGALATGGYYAARGAFALTRAPNGTGLETIPVAFTNNQNFAPTPLLLDSWSRVSDVSQGPEILMQVSGRVNSTNGTYTPWSTTLFTYQCPRLTGHYAGATADNSVRIDASFDVYGASTFSATVTLNSVAVAPGFQGGATSVAFPPCVIQGLYYSYGVAFHGFVEFSPYASTCYAGFVVLAAEVVYPTRDNLGQSIRLQYTLNGPGSAPMGNITLTTSP